MSFQRAPTLCQLLTCGVLALSSIALHAEDPSVIRVDTDITYTYYGTNATPFIRLFWADRYHFDNGGSVDSSTGGGQSYNYPSRIQRLERIGNRIRLICQPDSPGELWYRRTEYPNGHYFSWDIGSTYPVVLEGIAGSTQLTCTTWMSLYRDQGSSSHPRPVYKPFALPVGSPLKVQLTVDLLDGATLTPELLSTTWRYRAHGSIDAQATPSLRLRSVQPATGSSVPSQTVNVEALIESGTGTDFDAIRFTLDALTPQSQTTFTRRDYASWSATTTFNPVAIGNHNLTAQLTSAGTTLATAASAFSTVANTPPVALNDTYELQQARPLRVDAATGVLANDSDANLDAITAQLVSTTSNGLLGLAADGSFTYHPNPGFVGTDTFTYRAADADDQSAVTTVSLTVTARTGVKIGFQLREDGHLRLPDAEVDGIVDVTVTILDGIGQHAQFYANMMVAPTTHHGHMITTSPWVRTMRFDTRRFYDGANLFSAHVHPHNHPGHPNTAIEIGTLRVRSNNANPAPNGDTELPEFTVRSSHINNDSTVGAIMTLSGQLLDDGPSIDIDHRSFQSEGGQVICHLGSSVLGRFRWSDRTPPWGEGSLVSSTRLVAYQKDHEVSATLVMFMSDEVGRANYAYKEVTLPARPAGVDAMPLIDAQIMDLHQGQEIVVPIGGSYPVRVRVTDPNNAMSRFDTVALWVGNRCVHTREIQAVMDDYDDTSNSVIVPMHIPAHEITKLQDAREGGQSSTAFAVWADFSMSRNPNRPSTEHIHLTSVRTSDYAYPSPQAHLAITSPAKNSPHVGTSIDVTYAVAGPLPTNYRIAYQQNGGAWAYDADKDGTITLPVNRGNHVVAVRITDANGNPINTPSSEASVNFVMINGNPVAAADSYVGTPGTTLRVSAANGVLSNDSDVENDPLQALVHSSVTTGTLRLQTDGSFELDIPADQQGMIVWVTEVRDDQGGSDLAMTQVRMSDSSGGSMVANDWRMTGGNAQHHSYVPGNSTSSPSLLWSKRITPTSNSMTRPATGMGMVFVGRQDTSTAGQSKLFAYTLQDGTQQWTAHFPSQTRTISDPCFHAGLIWLAGRYTDYDSARLYAFDARNGDLVFSQALRQYSNWRHAPTAFGDTITHPFYGSRLGLAAFRASNGEPLWQTVQASSNNSARWTASISNNAWFGTAGGVASKWNATTGAVTTLAGETSYGSFTVREMVSPAAHGIVLLPTLEALLAVDANTGNEIWRLPGAVSCSPSIADRLVFLVMNERLIACRIEDGVQVLNISATPAISFNTQMLVTDRHVVFDNNSRIKIIDYLTGEVAPDLIMSGHVAMADGKLIVARRDYIGDLNVYNFIDNPLPGVVIDSPAAASTIAGNQLSIAYHFTSGTPAEARVRLSLDGIAGTDVIDDDGLAVIDGISPGQYTLRAQVIDESDQAIGLPTLLDLTVISNRAPVAAADTYAVGQAQNLYISAGGVLDNDSDPEHSRLSAELLSQPSNGYLILESNGGFRYFPNGNFTGDDQFTYRCHDGDRSSNTATVTISVLPRSGPKIAITVNEDGNSRNPEDSVDGVVEATVTIWDGIGQHAQFYSNMMIAPTVEHGHMITTSPWTRRALIDTSTLYDGANLISVHVHPHGHPHGHHTYTVDFEVGTFMLRTDNNNPSPNGDTELPSMFIPDDQFQTTSTSFGGRISGDVQLHDDTGPLDISHNSSIGGTATVVAHLGNSVLGRFRWNTLNPPFAERQLVSFSNLSYFQQDTERSARIVFFFTDEVGRANYAYRNITIPAFTDANRDFLPFPAADVEFLNLNQGDSIVIPDDGSFPLRLRIHHPQQALHRYSQMSVWVGNRSVKIVDLNEVIAQQGEGLHHYDITVELPAREAEIMQNSRQGGLAATATPVWCDFTFGRSDNLPTSNHIHLSSFRTASYELPGQAPSLDIITPRAGETGTNPLTIDYITHGGVPADTRLAYNIDEGDAVISALGSSITLPILGTDEHDIRLWLIDEHGVALPNPEASAALLITIANSAPRPGLISRNVRYETRLDQAAGTITAAATDRDGHSLTCSLISPASHGSVVLSSDGGFSYTPANGFSGTDSFTYALDDGHGGVSNGTVILRVGSDGGLHSIPAEWGTYGNGPQHSGQVNGSIGPQDLELAWTKDFTSRIQPVVVGDGRVYVGPDIRHRSGNLEALNTQDGSLLWQHGFTPASSIDPPTFHEGKIYIARGNHSGDSQLWCLNAADHVVQWSSSYSIQWDRAFAPIVADGRVYMNGGYHGGIYGFDKNDGSQLFFQNLDSWDEWTPAYDQGRLFSWVNGFFREHDAISGDVLATVNIPWAWNGYSMNTVASLDRGYAVLIGTKGAHGIDLTTMRSRWWLQDANYTGTAATSDGIVVLMNRSNRVDIVDLIAGDLRQSITLPSQPHQRAQPIITYDTIIVPGLTETWIIDRQDFSIRQTIGIGGPIAMADKHLYIVGDQELHAYRIPDNQAPQLVTTLPTEIEDTDSDGMAELNVDASNSSDADGDALSYFWYVDGVAVATSATTTLQLAVGEHEILLEIFDEHGAWNRLTHTITVTAGTGSGPAVIAKSGSFGWSQNGRNSWKTLNFGHTFTDPIVFVCMQTFNGNQPTVMRVKDVSPTNCQVQMQEWAYLDGSHTEETIAWVVVERGDWTLSDGSRLIAGTSTVGKSDLNFNYGSTISGTPVMLAQIQTYTSSDPMTVRIDDPSSSGAKLRLQREEALGKPPGTEQVGWLVRSTGIRDTDASGRTADNHTHSWRNVNSGWSNPPAGLSVFCAMQSLDGGDTASVRIRNLNGGRFDALVEEEKSRDSEIKHTTERLGWWLLPAGELTGTPEPQGNT